MGKTACIAYAKGCPRSQIDCSKLNEYLSVNGWKIVYSIKNADLVLLHACAFARRPEIESIKFLKIAQRQLNEDAELIVFGCLPGTNKEILKENFSGTALTPETLSKLDDVIDAKIPLTDIPDPHLIEKDIDQARRVFSIAERFLVHFEWHSCKELMTRWLNYFGIGGDSLRAQYGEISYLKIASGCDNKCSYCAIRNATGPLQSKELDDIISEFRQGLQNGAKTFELIAGDVGAYGQDKNSNIVALLDELFSYKEHFTLLLSEFNLRWFSKYSDSLIDIISKNKDRIGFITLPVQSGSNKILGSMKRGHSAEDALNAIQRLKKEAPDIKLSTHVMIGFPGESDRDFEKTCSFLRSVQFDVMYLYPYSDRPHTVSQGFTNKVSEKTIKERMAKLRKEFGRSCQI